MSPGHPAVLRHSLRYLVTLTLGCGLTMAAATAHAGRPCDSRQPPSPSTVQQALNLAERTHQALNAGPVQVVVLARAGQDLSRYGLRYSHLGLAYRQTDNAGHPVWRVLHKLNQCGSAIAHLYRQGLAEFFMDDLWRFEAAWVVPSPEIQARLMTLMQDSARAAQLHHQPYSMVSYVWGQKYQQSNQWAIETLAAAMLPASDGRPVTRNQAQTWLQNHNYQPSVLRIGALTRLGGRITAANVAFDDHPAEKRFSDRIETVTVDSVFSWLTRAGLTQSPVVTLQ